MHLSSVGRADAFSFSHSLHFFPSALSGFLFAPQPYAVLFSVWAVPSQPYSRHEKRRCRSCATAAPCGPFGAQPSASGNLIASRQAHFSTITRLPSGSSISRSGSFRDGALSVGVGTAHRCTWRVGGTLSHPRSARAVSFSVRLRIRAHMRAHGLGRNTFPQALHPPLRPSAQSRLSQRLRPRG